MSSNKSVLTCNPLFGSSCLPTAPPTLGITSRYQPLNEKRQSVFICISLIMSKIEPVRHWGSFKIMKFQLFTCSLNLSVCPLGWGHPSCTGNPTSGTLGSLLTGRVEPRESSTQKHTGNWGFTLSGRGWLGSWTWCTMDRLAICGYICFECWLVWENLIIGLLYRMVSMSVFLVMKLALSKSKTPWEVCEAPSPDHTSFGEIPLGKKRVFEPRGKKHQNIKANSESSVYAQVQGRVGLPLLWVLWWEWHCYGWELWVLWGDAHLDDASLLRP